MTDLGITDSLPVTLPADKRERSHTSIDPNVLDHYVEARRDLQRQIFLALDGKTHKTTTIPRSPHEIRDESTWLLELATMIVRSLRAQAYGKNPRDTKKLKSAAELALVRDTFQFITTVLVDRITHSSDRSDDSPSPLSHGERA